jgi:hypothetical protein
MKNYSNIISLNLNSRGVYCIDTSMGCESGMRNELGGCYGDCYAAKSAKLYGYDFSKTVLRGFDGYWHEIEILKKINHSKAKFIRIGCSGDPSENWQHCINILDKLKTCNKEIVIITRHWTLLSDQQIEWLSRLNICINSSVSALDTPEIMYRSISQFKRLEKHLKSVLRIVSCDFNTKNETGLNLHQIQNELFKNEPVIDTIFRPSLKNKLVIDGIVNVSKTLFNGKKTLTSKFNKRTFAGKCKNCSELCGVGVKSNYKHTTRPGLETQNQFWN